jgi:hypothetical protein
MSINLDDSLATGRLGVFHLKRLWSRALRDRAGMSSGANGSTEWALDNVIYHGLGLPIEETIKYLYQTAPEFERFEDWILKKHDGVIHKNMVERINATIVGLLSGEQIEPAGGKVENVLTEDDISDWNENGYLAVSGLYSTDEVRAAEHAVWEHLAMDPHEPDTWYERSSDHGIMVQLFHHPALEVIRRSSKLRSVFAQIWETSDLWVSTDRVSFNPPERPGFEFRGPRLHWDVSLEIPIPFGVQGLVYLTDTAAEQGAFTCVPGFHTRIETWLESVPAGANPRDHAIENLEAMPVPGKAGDLVIWHQAIPHGSSPNRLTYPRIVEYVTMFPATAGVAENWK